MVFFFLAATVVLFLAAPAFAYLDIGTGSFVLQVLIATLLGALITIKSYWASIKAYFSKDKDGGDGAGEGEGESEKQ